MQLYRLDLLTCPQGFGLLYSPEFISLGSVIRDMLRPDLVLIGESDPASDEFFDFLRGALTDEQPLGPAPE